ncbi:unnamed protein product [Prorocentrum cordatum]|uniref:Decapping nuclease n=1 Tax=Prorocentrum cordatum TaxID=2364126 RepID=A0ABN9S8Z9_9DINO|nr:unnamed protein product [Polarella glacialis]
MTTKNMGAKTSKKGYRSVTHLAAPQLAKKHAHARSLDGNLHTFVRPVGHVITSQDRDSRLLCRLRMGLPMDYVQIADSAPEDAVDETLHQLEESMTNFLVVKFTKPGTVVWSAPLSGGASWRAAGEVLFAVQLNDGSGQVVVVRTPNFDIRYPNETSWVVRKTLTTRWRSMEEQLYTNLNGNSAQRMAANLSKLPALPMLDESGAEFARKLRKAHGKTDELPPVLLPSAGSDAEEVAVDRQASMFARGVQLPEVDTGDGYNRPIYVEKHAFVCRIRKREGGGVFCRRQSNNWWRAVLESCGDLGKELSLHDVRRAPTLEEDVDKVRRRLQGGF